MSSPPAVSKCLLTVQTTQVTLQLIPQLTSRFNVERYQVQWRTVPSSPMDAWNTAGCAHTSCQAHMALHIAGQSSAQHLTVAPHEAGCHGAAWAGSI